MAIYPTPSSANTAYLSITTGLPTITDFTAMGWFRQDPTSALRTFFYVANDDFVFGSNYIRVWNFNDASIRVFNGSTFDTTGSIPMLNGPTWYHVCYRKTGNLHEVFLSDETFAIDCSLQGSILINAGVTPTNLIVPVSRRCAVQDIKMWEAALTVAEIQAERTTAVAVRSANLYLTSPLPTLSDLTDTSGNGHNWALGGSAVVTAGPPDLFGTPGPPPDPPTDLVGTAVGFETVEVTWVDNGVDETTQQLQRCSGSGCTSWATIATLGPDVESYTDEDILPLTFYRYRIRATNVYGTSDWSDIAEVTSNPNYAVHFPGTPGTYYHTTNSLARPFPNVAFGSGGWLAYVRIASSGYATFVTSLENFARAFTATAAPADVNEWDYASEVQSWIWFGVVDGVLTFEAQDGRIAARLVTATTVSYDTPGARDAAVAAFRATYASLPHNEAVDVPIPTYSQTSFGITHWFADFPGGANAPADPGHPDLSQRITVTGPALTPGQWYRVGYRWRQIPAPPVSGPLTSAPIELWVDCGAAVEDDSWDCALMGNKQFSFETLQVSNGGLRRVDYFVGGDPNELHRNGAAVTAFDMADMKAWPAFRPGDSAFEDECACGTAQPQLWWKERDTADTLDYGFGGSGFGLDYPVLAVGTITNVADADEPWNPCNGEGGGVEPPPPPPPPPETGTVVVVKQVPGTDDLTAFNFTALLPPPSPVIFTLTDGDTRTFSDVPVGAGYSVLETPNPDYTTVYTVSNGSDPASISVGAGEAVTVTVQNNPIPVPEPPVITGLTVDCVTGTVIVIGGNFTDDMVVSVSQNGVAVAGFTIVSRSATEIVVALPASASGTNQFCATVGDATPPNTLCTIVDCPGCPSVVDDPTLRFIVTVLDEYIVTTTGDRILGLAP